MLTHHRRRVRWVGLGILGLLIAWSLAVVLSEPVIGWANNFDFARSSACTGLWSSLNGHILFDAHKSGPLGFLISGQLQSDSCLPSSDQVFSFALVPWIAKGGFIATQWLGLLHLIVLIIPVSWLALRTRSLAILWTITISYFLIFNNLNTLGFFNALYADSSVLIATYLAAMFLIALVYDPSRRTVVTFLITCLAMGWLALAKDLAFPLALVLLITLGVFVAVMKKWRVLAVVFLIVLGVILVNQHFHDRHTYSFTHTIAMANADDAIYGVMLPAITTHGSLSATGIPQECRSFVHTTWYSAPRSPAFLRCSDWAVANRTSITTRYFATLTPPLSALQTALTQSWGLAPQGIHLSEHPGRPRKVVQVTSGLSVLSWTSRILPAATFGALMLYVAWPLGLLVTIVAASGVRSKRRASSRRWLLVGLCTGLGVLIQVAFVVSALLGDGFHELARHGYAQIIGIAFEVIGFGLLAGLLLLGSGQATAPTGQFLGQGEDLRPIVGHTDGVLEMSGE